MATANATTGYAFTSGETVTPAKLNSIVNSAAITINPVTATGTPTQRTLEDRFADVQSVKDFGAVGDGISNDTSAIVAASAAPHIVVTSGTYNTSSTIVANATIAGDVKYTGTGRLVTLDNILGRVKQFLEQRLPDDTNATLPNSLRRSLQIRRTASGQPESSVVPSRTLSSTSMALAVNFLAEYALKSNARKDDIMPLLVQSANYLAGMQYVDATVARFGGIRTADTDANTTCLGSALAGQAFIASYKATGLPQYLTAARNVATYLATLANPNPVYQSLYSETPIPSVAENASFAGFCDRIQSNDTINITSSTWNATASAFLKQLYDLIGGASLLSLYQTTRDYHAYGALNGFDYFAIRNSTPSSKVSVAWPFFSGHSAGNGAWYRLGSFATGTPNTVGTDQIEYALDALLETGYSQSLLASAYSTYVSLAHASSNSFSAAYDGAICFTGFFRINSPVYGGAGGAPINVGTSRAFGDYYDVQGVGTLLPFKKALFPDDYRKSLALAAVAPDRGALVNESFDTVWSTGTGFDFYTKGIIPIAKTGLGILKSMNITQ